MRRLGLLAAVAVIAVAAASLPTPAEAPEPLAGVIIDRPGLETPVEAAIWYCAWAQANATRDTLIAVASIEETEAELTFPVAIPGEDPDTATLQMVGPGGAALDLSEVALRGDSPAFIEFGDGPAAASTTVIGQGVVAADTCVAEGPAVWHFAGGSTNTGEVLTLRLFNPFPEGARVTVTAVSEIGVEALAELRGIAVNARGWRDISFEELLRQRQDLVVTVSVEEGSIAPAMLYASGSDEAWWSGVEAASTWELPIARVDGLDSSITVFNPGPADATVTLDLYRTNGPEIGVQSVTIAGETSTRIDLGEVVGAPLSARISATAPVVAAVTAVGEPGLAVTSGTAARAQDWLIPGARSVGPDRATLWLLNTGEDPLTVTVSALTGGGLVGERVTVDPGSVLGFEVDEQDAVGYMVQASAPFSVGWSVAGAGGVAFASAEPLRGE